MTTPVPDPVTSMSPVAVAHTDGSFTVPMAITGGESTVTTVATDVAEQPFPSVNVTE